MFKPYSDSPVESPESNLPVITAPKALRDKEQPKDSASAPIPNDHGIVALESLRLPDRPREETWKRNAFVLDKRTTAFIAGRTKQLPMSGGLLMVFFGVLLSTVFWIPEAVERSTALAHANRGIRVTAEVISKRYTVSRGKSTTYYYYITYTYRTQEEAQYTTEESVSYDLYTRASKGMQLPMTYLPENPRATHLADNTKSGNWGFVALMCSLFGIPLMIGGWITNRRNIWLSKRGQIVRGEVIKATGSRTKNGYNVSIRYSFIDAYGKTVTGRRSSIRNDLRSSAKLPPYGTPVYVLYDGDKMHRIL